MGLKENCSLGLVPSAGVGGRTWLCSWKETCVTKGLHGTAVRETGHPLSWLPAVSALLRGESFSDWFLCFSWVLPDSAIGPVNCISKLFHSGKT